MFIFNPRTTGRMRVGNSLQNVYIGWNQAGRIGRGTTIVFNEFDMRIQMLQNNASLISQRNNSTSSVFVHMNDYMKQVPPYITRG